VECTRSELSPHTHPARLQVESTLSMQAMQPKVKALQAKYANDPERLQVGAGVLFIGCEGARGR
jgi:membrane protein insertase Oxa1/YidC/SpoIIIJ